MGDAVNPLCTVLLHSWQYTPDRNFRRCSRCLKMQVQDYWERSGWAEVKESAVEIVKLWERFEE